MTPVLFRADRHSPFKGDVTAVFPTLEASPGQMTCYQHVGQHSGCTLDWYYTTRPATPAEYKNLLQELICRGYDDLRIYHRRPPC